MTPRKEQVTARRVALVIVGLNTVMILIGLVSIIIYDIDLVSQINGFLLMWPFFSLLYGLMGVLILSRHPRHTVGWLFMIISFMAACTTLLPGIVPAKPEDLPEAVFIILSVIFESVWIMALLIPMTLVLQFFPNGRLPSRRWWPIPVATILIIGIMATSFVPDSTGLFEDSSFFDLLNNLTNALLPIVVLGSLAAVVVRYLRSKDIERAQMKWLVYTAVTAFLLGFLLLLVLDEDNLMVSIYFTSLPTLIALAVGLAILRYRLYDIDIIIRRTLQYGLVTGILILVYFVLVVVFQALFRAMGNQQSEILIVVSTLIIAALFNPLRLWVQKAVDRRFYRGHYDAEQALARFSAAARDEVDLERLMAALLDVVEETMQPVSISLFLSPDENDQ